MAKRLCCSVFDVKAGVFGIPFYSLNKATALRDFEAACLDGLSLINKFPNDYELWIVAEWDDELGEFDNGFSREFVCRGSAFSKE